jgi:hypothetical protein
MVLGLIVHSVVQVTLNQGHVMGVMIENVLNVIVLVLQAFMNLQHVHLKQIGNALPVQLATLKHIELICVQSLQIQCVLLV